MFTRTQQLTRRHLPRIALAVLIILAGRGALLAQNTQPPRASSAAGDQKKSGTDSTVATLPRGKKLMLKDGSFQLIREYQIEGDRVRYYSLDSLQWEEMPADLVDWDKTKKIEADQ